MAEIRVLSQAVADKIAAGEVVERPSAVVKELVENSIDAGATEIRVEIKKGGIKYISVADNGEGISKDALECAFLRHATSKLREIEDLGEISTMGFRGEALASICAVAEVTVTTRTKDCDAGVCMSVHHGEYSDKTEVACNVGTTMVVENLFANVPARMKFLKKDSTESGYLEDVLSRVALANPGIKFSFVADGKEVFLTTGDGKLKNVVLSIYGIEHAKALLEVDYTEHGIRVHGVVGKAELSRGNRSRQTLIVNGRYIKNHVVAKVVEEAFRNVLMTGKFPFFVLNIDLRPELVDVNVHPAKTEIKFADEKEIYNILHRGVKNAIYHNSAVPSENHAARSVGQRAFDTSGPDRQIIKEFMQNTALDRIEFGGYSFKSPDKAADTVVDPKMEEKSAQSRMTVLPKAVYYDKEADLLKTIDESKSNEDLKADCAPLQLSMDFGEAETEMEAEDKTELSVVGQVFDTYVIAQSKDGMFLIDQHAAHERKRFEMLKADRSRGGVSGQILLSPIVMDIDAVELQAVRDNQKLLLDTGFVIEEFGRGSIIIRETPLIGDEEEIKALAQEVIDILKDQRPLGVLSFEERLLDMVSCKYAIKANKKLSLPEMEGLLRDVMQMEKDGISTCPHGRPIKIKFTKYEIEKMFKRIV